MQTDLVRELLRHRDALMALIFALTRDRDDAEEVFQDTAVAILAEADRGARPDDFAAWARTVARHRVADFYRKQRRGPDRVGLEPAMAEAVVQAFDEHAFAAAESQARLAHLARCLEALAGRARRIIDLRYRDHRPIREIAAAIAWKEPAVRVALTKARKALARCVERRLRAESHPNP